MFRRYDDQTGRPRDMFLCEDWQPVPGSKNEIRVSAPELAIMLPSGMIATISADEGQITVDRVEQSQMRPKTGWLEGNAKIVVDRETGVDRTPSAERPEDVITIALDRLEFDLEGGELKTDGRVAVSSDDFEIAGSGLNLVWNQADNRIETLTLARGEEFVLYPAAGLFGMVNKTEPVQAEEAEPATAPAAGHDWRGSASGRRIDKPRTCVRWMAAWSPSNFGAPNALGGSKRTMWNCFLTWAAARIGSCGHASPPRHRPAGRHARTATGWCCAGTAACAWRPPQPGRPGLPTGGVSWPPGGPW